MPSRPGFCPGLWSVCALGAAVTGLVWLRFRHAAWKALPENEPLSGMAAADCYVLLYLFCLLSFALLMAMGGNAGKAIPEWPCMATGTMVVGLTGSAIVVAAGFVLSGVWRSCLTVLVAGLWVLAVLWLAARAMQGLPTQALIDTGMLDRRGPFWAVVAALIELPLVRYLALRYAQDGGNRRGRSVYLFGRLERPAMLVLLPCLLQWMAWQLAGCYGLGLAGAVVAVSLTMWLPFDLASAAVQAEGEQAKSAQNRSARDFADCLFHGNDKCPGAGGTVLIGFKGSRVPGSKGNRGVALRSFFLPLSKPGRVHQSASIDHYCCWGDVMTTYELVKILDADRLRQVLELLSPRGMVVSGG